MKIKLIKNLRVKDGDVSTLYKAGFEYNVDKDFAEKHKEFIEQKAIKKYENKAVEFISEDK